MNKEDFQIRYKLLKLDGPTIDRIRQMAEGGKTGMPDMV